ncbi:SART-1 protein [Annulohypoxylon maeteangense]|uniref:SART-1 protein n=1 Tax=Annulohypoxylon maeteangense TaxID=1927788 RepID=UPI00200817E3|nr:SART-1 protein [Annulohypoxylon maeteangense]KAI0884714.1 SART-1 protein [Annulohypoxylon maeteangense]
MDAAQIEETNRLRVSLGMKPLPVPGASGPQFKEKASTPDEDVGSTLESREAVAYDNYKKIQDAEKNKKKREAKAAAIKKARDAAKRIEVIDGKGLGDADEGELDTKGWLISQKKRQKQIEKARKLEQELAAAEAEAAAAIQYTSKDLAGVKVGHEIESFEDGEEQILTLKDSNILGDDDEEGDELENINLREREKLDKKLESKKKKPVYDPNAIDETGEQSLLGQYDEEIVGKKGKRFTLDGFGNTIQKNDIGSLEAQSRQRQMINLDFLKDDQQPASDYMDISEVKIKKPKKKKSKSTRQRPVDEDDIFPLPEADQDQSMDIDSGAGFINRKRKTDDAAFVDDEDLQATLAAQRRDALKKRKRMRPEDIAKQLREEAQTPDDNEADGSQEGGLVLDEISEFVSGLKKEDIEDRKPRKPKSPKDAQVTAMEDESDEDELMKDGYDIEHDRVKREESAPAETAIIGVDEEKSIGSGVGAALQLLRERQLLKDSGAGDLNETQRQQQIFIAEKKRKLADIEQQARDQRERDRNSGRLDRMSVREREEWARQQNNMRDQQTSRQLVDLFNKGYKPNVELKYHDELGRSLDQKEAFKHLSHQFHGKGSGKGKTDKRLKKIEDEKRRESQSMLDASQNVGMSSATAQQTKKRKEAGVRLA